jgi:tetratricopeptide (TPR) repeat protein
VVCGVNYVRGKLCDKVPTAESYSLTMADGQNYQVRASSVTLMGNKLDLAMIQFRSNRNYAVAKVSAPGSLKIDDDIYTAGFPFEKPGFTLGQGNAIAVVNKRLTDDKGGYTIVYNALTLPGMSGGGVFNGHGQLVAIHGQGDKYRENTEIDDDSKVNNKIGYNRGIPVQWLVKNLAALGINLNTASSIADSIAENSQLPITADEYFIAGFNKFVDPGDDVMLGKHHAIQDLSQAIHINPQYDVAYFIRAIVYGQVQDFYRSLSDYDKCIALNPNFSAYSNRADLKSDKLNDIQGALEDFNQAISLNPKNSMPYNNRGVLKVDKLNDAQGALKDFNQAISLNPKDFQAYRNRALLKAKNLDDIQGALTDFNQAILINTRYSAAYSDRALLRENNMNDIQGALADYNQAISLNPKFSLAYYNRANLKKNKLNDIQEALTDYNQAILINPKLFEAYANRANLKYLKLNDVQGALADYNQAILINSKFSTAYYNRGILKKDNLNDQAGAIQDIRQAARLFREQGNNQNLQLTIRALQQLGVSE